MLKKNISGPEGPPEGAQGGAMTPWPPLGTSLEIAFAVNNYILKLSDLIQNALSECTARTNCIDPDKENYFFVFFPLSLTIWQKMLPYCFLRNVCECCATVTKRQSIAKIAKLRCFISVIGLGVR